jgi:hypothetical protein
MPAVSPKLAASGFRPHAAGHHFQQLRLACAIAAHEQPALAGLNAKTDVAQNRALTAIEIDALERDGE